MITKKRHTIYLDVKILAAAEKKRKETKTFTTNTSLVNALLFMYVKGDIVFK